MDFALTETQKQLRDVAHDYLADRFPLARIAALAASAERYEGGDRALWEPADWAALADLGWWDPGLGFVERTLLAEQSGYALHPVPWWGRLALTGPAPVVAEPTGLAVVGEPSLVATADGDHWRLAGEVTDVPDGPVVDSVVVAAATDRGPALFRLRHAGQGRQWQAADGGDLLRRSWLLRCTDAPADLLEAPGNDGRSALAARAVTLLAGEAVGVAERAYQLAADHARVRTQFGRPVGSFQAVSFRIADSYVQNELARSLVYRAAWLVGAADPAASPEPSGSADPHHAAGTVEAAVAAAVVAARTAAVSACECAIQVHGGLGMTWENPLHHWYRRALWFDSFGAPTRAHLADLAGSLLGS